MIAITTASGALLRTLAEGAGENTFGFHKVFGWINVKRAAERAHNRKKFGLKPHFGDWLCQFTLTTMADGCLEVKPLLHCQISAAADGKWRLRSAFGEFFIAPRAETALPELLLPAADKSERTLFTLACVLTAICLLPLLTPWFTESPPEAEKIVAPVAIKIIPLQKAAVVPRPESFTQTLPKIAVESQQVRKEIKQKLGFLDLLGRKDLKKALGGTPSQIKDASPGAGAGGSQGSGGEYLAGLGEGVKKTTVGNTGIAGLGGIGTKGRGGGLGGYGNSLVANGNVARISSIPLANDVMIEGGLSQAVIQATIAKYLSQIRACYENGLRKNPGLTGVISTRFEISASGDLASSDITNSTLGDAGVEKCILHRMNTWKFPKPIGGVKVRVNYPFLLKPVTT